MVFSPDPTNEGSEQAETQQPSPAALFSEVSVGSDAGFAAMLAPAGDGACSGRSAEMTSRRSSLLLLFVLIVGITLGLAWITTRDPVSQTQWDRIKVGMSREQVIAILGNPDRIDGPTQIEYRRAFNAGWVEFTFDATGRLIEKNDESVFVSLDRRPDAEQAGSYDGG